MKKILISFILILVISGAVIFIYRLTILQYSAEAFIRKALPPYITIDTIKFNFADGKAVFGGFRIENPKGFSDKYIIEIDKIICGYKMKGRSFFDGIEITSPIFKKASLNIERLGSGEVNLVSMGSFMAGSSSGTGNAPPAPAASSGGMTFAGKSVSDLIKLPETFLVEDARAIFIDRLVKPGPHLISFERVNGDVTLKLNTDYSGVLTVASVGQGHINGEDDEIIRWNISFDPNTPRITMSSRFDVSGVDVLPFEPYYDKYSPLVFRKGRFSGTLVFDFDDGSIGSTNEIHLSGLQFYVKPGYENAQFWETTVPDLVKYFTSPYGDIVFDFKIKGDVQDPKFYLGPISKQALVSMAIDKISAAIDKASANNSPGAPKSDLEKAKDYVDLFKGLLNKK